MRHFSCYALLIMLGNEFAIAEIETLYMAFMHVSRYGACVLRVFSPYFMQWLDGLQRFFSCCSLPILLCNGQKIAEHETYWLMGFLLGGAFYERILRIFCNGCMHGLQKYFSCCSLFCVTNATKLSTKQTGLSVFR